MVNSDSVGHKGVETLALSKYSWMAVGKRKLGGTYTRTHYRVPWKGYIELLRSSSCGERENFLSGEAPGRTPDVLGAIF